VNHRKGQKVSFNVSIVNKIKIYYYRLRRAEDDSVAFLFLIIIIIKINFAGLPLDYSK
jgi:hypothetical protein